VPVASLPAPHSPLAIATHAQRLGKLILRHAQRVAGCSNFIGCHDVSFVKGRATEAAPVYLIFVSRGETNIDRATVTLAIDHPV
jgi:hypothetical protein